MPLVTNYYQSLIDIGLFLFFVVGAKVIILFTIRGEKPSVLRSRYLLWMGFGAWWFLSAIEQIFPWAVMTNAHQLIDTMYALQPAWLVGMFRPVAIIWTAQPVTWNIVFVVFQFLVAIMLLTERENIAGWITLLLATLFSLATWVATEALGQVASPRLSIVSGSPGAGFVAALVGVLLLVHPDVWKQRKVVVHLRHTIAIFYALAAVIQLRPRFWTEGIAILFDHSPYRPWEQILSPAIRVMQGGASYVNALVVLLLAFLAILLWKNVSHAWIVVVSAILLLFCWIFGQNMGLQIAIGGNLNTAPLVFLLTMIVIDDPFRTVKRRY